MTVQIRRLEIATTESKSAVADSMNFQSATAVLTARFRLTELSCIINHNLEVFG